MPLINAFPHNQSNIKSNGRLRHFFFNWIDDPYYWSIIYKRSSINNDLKRDKRLKNYS